MSNLGTFDRITVGPIRFKSALTTTDVTGDLMQFEQQRRCSSAPNSTCAHVRNTCAVSLNMRITLQLQCSSLFLFFSLFLKHDNSSQNFATNIELPVEFSIEIANI